MEDINNITDKIINIYSEQIILDKSFLDIGSYFADIEGTVVLASGGKLDCSRYHIMGINPWFTFKSNNNIITIKVDDKIHSLKDDPFNLLKKLLNNFNIDNLKIPLSPIIKSGFLGYLSYDLKDLLEKLPRTTVNDLKLPDICLYIPSLLLVHDISDNCTFIYMTIRENDDEGAINNRLKHFFDTISSNLPINNDFKGDLDNLKSNFDKENYINAINSINSYIKSGDIYQVNLSQRFEMEFEGNPYSLFKNLYEINPAPFYAFINAGDHQIVSTSPERFVKRIGKNIETRPIKGTRPRGKTILEDENNRAELLNSKKDDAELSMIVDLLRNDFGKVCVGGSVKVTEHKRLEAYQNVYHLISIITGILDEKYDPIDLLKAIFPGGSITGCPKIRAMEIIDELESERRHVYTGSIGYISFHDTMDLSIAIRTATVYNGKIYFSVGGGIVYDSDPYDEYNETLDKGKTLIEVFKGKKKDKIKRKFVWLNGSMICSDLACINIFTQGFQYGYGFFETIRVDNGKPKFLEDHIERFNNAWKKIFNNEISDLTWNHIIDQVIDKNDLSNQIAVVKIIASRGKRDTSPFDYNLIVTAKKYIHRLEGKKEAGLNILTYPNRRHTPLADYKTLNYLLYLQAGNWAKENGADEALILNTDGTISETNSANILMIKNKKVIIPISSHVLPGIMSKKVCNLLLIYGYNILEKEIFPDELFDMDEVIAANSLIGAVKILTIDNRKLNTNSNLWIKINNEILF